MNNNAITLIKEVKVNSLGIINKKQESAYDL